MEATAALGCYGSPNACNGYYVCSRGISYPFCCPLGSRFNSSTCACDEDNKCRDYCDTQLAYQLPPTSVAPPVALTNDKCRDSYGAILGEFRDINGTLNRVYFFHYDDESDDSVRYIRECSVGTLFTIDTCSCSMRLPATTVENPVAPAKYRQCLLYSPYDADFHDKSIHKMQSFADLSVISTEDPARGFGAAQIEKNGRVEYWGTSGIDFGYQFSLCFFFKYLLFLCLNFLHKLCPSSGVQVLLAILLED